MNDSAWLETAPLADLMTAAAAKRDATYGRLVSYSRKVFIPLTKLCRDVCHYCTFAERPRAGHAAYLSADEVQAIARAGQAAGCTEALFTLGEKPELRYRAALGEWGRAKGSEFLRHPARADTRDQAAFRHDIDGGKQLRRQHRVTMRHDKDGAEQLHPFRAGGEKSQQRQRIHAFARWRTGPDPVSGIRIPYRRRHRRDHVIRHTKNAVTLRLRPRRERQDIGARRHAAAWSDVYAEIQNRRPLVATRRRIVCYRDE